MSTQHTPLPVIAKLLRAIASGSDAQANKHDIILNAAANALDLQADMLAALQGVAVIAEQNITDLAAEAQEGAPVAKMEMARWNAVLAAIAKAEDTA